MSFVADNAVVVIAVSAANVIQREKKNLRKKKGNSLTYPCTGW